MLADPEQVLVKQQHDTSITTQEQQQPDSALVPLGLQIRRKLRRKHAFTSLNPACPSPRSPPPLSTSVTSSYDSSHQSGLDWDIWDGIYDLYVDGKCSLLAYITVVRVDVDEGFFFSLTTLQLFRSCRRL